MDNGELEQKVREIISTTLDVDIDDVDRELNIDNTPNWDSLKHLTLMIEIERKFHIQLEPAIICQVIDYPTIVETVMKLTKK